MECRAVLEEVVHQTVVDLRPIKSSGQNNNRSVLRHRRRMNTSPKKLYDTVLFKLEKYIINTSCAPAFQDGTKTNKCKKQLYRNNNLSGILSKKLNPMETFKYQRKTTLNCTMTVGSTSSF